MTAEERAIEALLDIASTNTEPDAWYLKAIATDALREIERDMILGGVVPPFKLKEKR